MLSSVPITIGEETYDLLFSPRDMFDLEGALRREGMKPFTVLIREDPHAFERLDLLALLIQYGLRKPGEPTRALSSDKAGLDKAISLLQEFTRGKPVNYNIVMANAVFEAMSAGDWFNAMAITRAIKEKEASASVPQGDRTPKNSEGPGLKRSKK